MSSEEEKIFSDIENVINQIDSGELKIGDEVYCTTTECNVIILEFPRHELIDEYYEKRKEKKFVSFSGRIKYKTKGRGKIGFASVATIVKLQEQNFCVEFSITKEKHKSTRFIEPISEAKNKGMKVSKKVDSEYYYYSVYGETQNTLYHAFSGYFSLLENVKWYRNENGEMIEFEFI